MADKINNESTFNPEILITTQTDIKNGISKRANHILITGTCNSNCVFCFSRKELIKEHFSIKILDEIMQNQFNLGCKILVLSGGEPTIHPDFIKIISNAKSIGYESIRVITNGRMFAYKKYLKNSINAGLNEATISIHSHIPEVQDYLSSIKGSFEQALKGIKNSISLGLDTKINIVVNKKNIENLTDTIAFFSKIGIKRIGLLRIMPYGMAWKNKNCLFYNHHNNLRYLNKALKFSRQNRIDIWANRFDLELFKDYPEFMQHPFKFVNEVESKIDEFRALTKEGKELFCYPERCNYCFLEKFCKELHEKNNKVKKGIKIKDGDSYLNEDNLIDPIKFAKYYIKTSVK